MPEYCAVCGEPMSFDEDLAEGARGIMHAGCYVEDLDDPREDIDRDHPPLQLVGTDGNAFAIIGKALRAAKEAGWSKTEVDELQAEMTAGDYDHLLGVCMQRFDVY